MRTRLAVIAVTVAAATGLFAAPSALAAGEVCYDVNINVAGQGFAQAGCQPIG